MFQLLLYYKDYTEKPLFEANGMGGKKFLLKLKLYVREKCKTKDSCKCVYFYCGACSEMKNKIK